MVKAAESLKVIETLGLKKKKKYNKNRKKAWRKKIDLTDIEEAFEDKSREERHGGPVEEKESVDIFTLDLGEASAEKKFDKNANFFTVDVPKSSEGLKPSKKVIKKNLKCFKYLKGLPGVKAISKKKGTQPQNIPKKMKLMKKVQGGSIKSLEALSSMVGDSRKNISSRLKSRKKSHLSHNFKKDIWSEDAFYKGPVVLDKKTEVERSFLEAPMQHITQTMKPSRNRVPPKKPVDLPAVPVPKAGTSYNPTREAHGALLRSAEDQLRSRREKHRKEMNFIKLSKPRKEEMVTFDERLREMSEGLEDFDRNILRVELTEVPTEEKDEDAESEPETTHHAAVCYERKTEKERKKVKTRQIKELKIRRKKERIAREAEVSRAKNFNKEIKKNQEEEKKAKEKKVVENRKKAKRTKILSKNRYKPMKIAAPLPEELPKSLLEVTALSNPLEERFDSITRRSLAVTKPPIRRPKKRRRKIFTKRGAKIDVSKYVRQETTV